ncbi:IQ domain-containing protein F5-like [Erinaceus europaeus]|uniref:IQ domain-containing protein F5-like n=1 Tax=Erinaceus europaeus TaxID=9365 RepID=A0ABM3YII4_ERIEU|nr:IQ domain-containing protein F5-like [Erinaceus europaeus]
MGNKCCKKKPEKEETVTVKEPVKIPEEPVKPIKPKKTPPLDDVQKAKAIKIQAWWRGTLVRRTLLHASLRAWIIQNWWRQMQVNLLKRQQLAVVQTHAWQLWAVVKLQSWVRMWHIRQGYRRLLDATRIIQFHWRWHSCHTRGCFWGSYEITANQLDLELMVFLGSQICRMTDCIPFPIKD